MPAEWLQKGQNSLTILELRKPQQNTLPTLGRPILSKLRPLGSL